MAVDTQNFFIGFVVEYDRENQTIKVKMADGNIRNFDTRIDVGTVNIRQGFVPFVFNNDGTVKRPGTTVFGIRYGGRLKVINAWNGYLTFKTEGTITEVDGTTVPNRVPVTSKPLEGEVRIEGAGEEGKNGGYAYFQQNGDVGIYSGTGISGIKAKDTGDLDIEGAPITLTSSKNIDISTLLSNITMGATGEIKLKSGLASITLSPDGTISFKGIKIMLGTTNLTNYLNGHGHVAFAPGSPTSTPITVVPFTGTPVVIILTPEVAGVV